MTQGHVWNFSHFLLWVLKVMAILSVRKKIKVICTLFLNLILVEGNGPRSCVKFQPFLAPGFESYGHFKCAKKNKSYLHTFFEPDSCRGQWPKVMCEISAYFRSGFWKQSKKWLKFHTWPWVIVLYKNQVQKKCANNFYFFCTLKMAVTFKTWSEK